ncbi:MAG: hypothetical protein AB1898_08635 [Acidobacteriota bacterium]
MDWLVPLALLALGLGAAHLALKGLVKLKNQQEVWLFGLGVRSRPGAVKVLIVAIALLVLGYSVYRRGNLRRVLVPEPDEIQSRTAVIEQRLAESQSSIQQLRSQLEELGRENQTCQEVVSKQGLGLANRNDTVGELRASLVAKQRDLISLQDTLNQTKQELNRLQSEQSELSQTQVQTLAKMGKLESEVSSLLEEKSALMAKLDKAGAQSSLELRRLKEELGRWKSQYRDEERRAALLRQGLALREANDWTLDQEIQRLANLISDQPDVSPSRQTDITRAIQRVNQVLREGVAITKQAKAIDVKRKADTSDKEPVSGPPPGKD